MSKWPCADCGQGVDAYVDPITGDESVALCYDCAEERMRHRVELVVGKKMMRPRRQEVRHRCDWMTDEQLTGYIESTTGLLHEALEEQKERRERRKGGAE